MSDVVQPSTPEPTQAQDPSHAHTLSELELAQALAERLAIKPKDWHRLNRNRKVRAGEQIASALVYLLKDQPEEALIRLQQATGWLDHSLQAPPCPTHGPGKKQ
ncbi:MAG TPA: DUF6439 family protein [Leptolyngbyaceae cyanobacterium]